MRPAIRLVALALTALAAVTSSGACASMRAGSAEPAQVAAPEPVPLAARPHAVAVEILPQVDSVRIPIGNSPQRGRPEALVTIVAFSDFQCPFCARVVPTLEAVRERYGDDVRLVFKHHPLPFHTDAQLAAEASMEVYNQLGVEAFWRYHDLLFQNQRALDRPHLETYATELQVDMVRFRSALDQRVHRQAVDADAALAAQLGLGGTPSFMINGTQLVGALPAERFYSVVDAVLARARTIVPRERAYAEMTVNPVVVAEAERPVPPRQPVPQLDPDTRYNVPVADAPTQGPADALVTIVEFTDFQCPFCARVQPTLAALRERYPADVRIAYRHLPLDFHQNARLAAEAAQEVFAQRGHEAFWRYHDLLFQNQRELERPTLERLARALRVNMGRFRSALDRRAHEARVDADLQLSQMIGANGTPHFFINGRRLVGARPLDQFVAAVERELADARAEVARGTPRAAVYAALTANGATRPVYLPAPGAQAPQQNPVYRVAANPSAPSRGAANARVVIQVFSDFQCPFCSRVEPTLAQVLARYPNDVRLVWRDYPLAFHANAMPAAEAAREAHAQQGDAGFWRMHELLFRNQQALERADLERYAANLQLDMNRFRAALDQHVHERGIRADMAAADATGVAMGTPSFFINGRFLAGAMPFDEFARAIDAELGRAGTP